MELTMIVKLCIFLAILFSTLGENVLGFNKDL
jgi:hypothetical protein